MFCNKCGRQIPDDAIFCSWCGETIVRVQENPFNEAPATEYNPPEPTETPKAEDVQNEPPAADPDLHEEQEFLDMTHRLLRWERMAWSITGKVLIILSIVFAAIFSILAVVGMFSADAGGGVAVILGILYGTIYGGMFLALGIVSAKAAGKIPQYLDSMYYDFEKTEKRSGSIGMLVLTVLFNEIAFIFFIINFVRIKSNGKLIERIKARQKNQ